MKLLLSIIVAVAFISAGLLVYVQFRTPSVNDEISCTMEALLCPDGSSVGRVGPNCEFAPCPTPEVGTGEGSAPDDVEVQIAAKSNLIVLSKPELFEIITSPLTITGKARGTWFFEGSFPVILVNWDGLIIAQGVATAQGDWMTEGFVPFTATLKFEKPTNGTAGTLILRKDNPSGLPEHDDALEVPIRFDVEELIPV